MNKKKIIKIVIIAIAIILLTLLFLYRAEMYARINGLKVGDVNKMLFENDYSVSFCNEVIPLGNGNYSSKSEELYVYNGKIVYTENRKVKRIIFR